MSNNISIIYETAGSKDIVGGYISMGNATGTRPLFVNKSEAIGHDLPYLKNAMISVATDSNGQIDLTTDDIRQYAANHGVYTLRLGGVSDTYMTSYGFSFAVLRGDNYILSLDGEIDPLLALLCSVDQEDATVDATGMRLALVDSALYDMIKLMQPTATA